MDQSYTIGTASVYWDAASLSSSSIKVALADLEEPGPTLEQLAYKATMLAVNKRLDTLEVMLKLVLEKLG